MRGIGHKDTMVVAVEVDLQDHQIQHPVPTTWMTCWGGGYGGGGHGHRTETPISNFGYPVYSPSWSTRPNITPIYPGPENYAQPGAYATGGGGGGTSGSPPSYRAGSGGPGIAILRYPV